MDEDAGRLRLRMFAFVALVLFGALFTRLWFLQGIESDEYQATAEALVLRQSYEEAPRGRILDREGRVLVDNEVVDVVTINKAVVDELGEDERNDMFHRLAVAISRSGRLTKLETIVDELRSDHYGAFDVVPVAVDVGPRLMVFLGERADEFPGVEVVSRTVRSYPYGSLAAHVLGYVGPVTQGELETANARVSDDGDTDAETSTGGAKVYRLADEIGKSGVEGAFENVLRGESGVRYFEVDNRGRVIRERTELGRDPVPGDDLVLTIDIDLQALVEQQLADGLAAQRDNAGVAAPAGSVVATDPMTGELLAMASFPTYGPADFVNGISYAQFDLLNAPDSHQPLLNRTIQERYSAGSTFKLVTAFAALEAGYLEPGSRIEEARNGTIEDRGTYTLPQCRDDFEASDTCLFSSPRAGLDPVTYPLPEAIAESSDVFFYKLAAEGFYPEPVQGPEGDEAIQAMARRFGFGSPTAIQLPNERAGVVPDRAYFDAQAEAGVFDRDGSQWFPGDTVLLSIGQGELYVTPTQLVNAYATMANGGTLFQINVARRIQSPDGEIIREFGSRALRDIDLDPADYALVERGLLGVTVGRGTAADAFAGFPLSLFPVAAKTGTAEVDDKEDTSLFAAYGPVDDTRDPEIAIAVVLEEAGFGSAVAAPIARNVLEAFANDSIPRFQTADEAARAAADGTDDSSDATDSDEEVTP